MTLAGAEFHFPLLFEYYKEIVPEVCLINLTFFPLYLLFTYIVMKTPVSYLVEKMLILENVR